MTRVAIHQPEHLPWLGFFEKALQADVLVLLDHVPFSKNYFQNRNRIRTAAGVSWLTVPVLTKGRFRQAIADVEIANTNNPRWRHKCWASLEQAYKHAPYFLPHSTFFRELYEENWTHLVELNCTIIRYLLRVFDIRVSIVSSSQLEVQKCGRTRQLVSLCRELGATQYLSGVSGREYVEISQFREANIEVMFQDFRHPRYEQLHTPFVERMSAVDLLFNCGPNGRKILEAQGS